ncbi:MAG: amidohydrolase [Candidatus Thorarchaeota archaeon]
MNLEADLVVFNGNIITMDPENPRATAIAVKNYKFLVVGTDTAVIDLVQSAKRVIDLGGKTVVPGFVDAHTHMTFAGIQRGHVDLSGAESLEHMKEILRRKAAETPPGRWIRGYNWDESVWPERRYPTAKDLDKVSTDHPIAIDRVDLHMLVTNTPAMEKLKFPMDHEGVVKDKKGRPLGVFRDIEGMHDKFPTDYEELCDAVVRGSRLANSHGITTVVDNVRPDQIRPILDCERKKLLTARYVVNPRAEQLKHMISIGLTSGFGGPMFRIGGVKSFMDGSIGSRTAYLSEPYADDPKNVGKLFIEEKKMTRFLAKAIDNGVQTVTHAIGDRAIDTLLNAFEALSEKRRALVREQRHRIEHAEMMTKDQIRRAVSLGVILSMQPNFVGRWQGPGGLYEQRLGEDRTSRMNMFRVALDNGARICFGSDGMPYGPLYGIWAATTHPNPKVRISVEEALRCYTLEGAYSVFMERTVGSITVGKRADFVVLSEDIMTIDPMKIKYVQIESTFVGGIEEFSRARNRGF